MRRICKRRRSVLLVVLGDLDGNGLIDTTDYMRVKSALLRGTELDAAVMKAADVDGNDVADTTDYIRIKAHFFENFIID